MPFAFFGMVMRRSVEYRGVSHAPLFHLASEPLLAIPAKDLVVTLAHTPRKSIWDLQPRAKRESLLGVKVYTSAQSYKTGILAVLTVMSGPAPSHD